MAKKKHPASSQIEIASLIDLIFLLLIFFIVSSTFHKPSLTIELPESESATISETQNQTHIYMNKHGKTFINNTPFTYNMIIKHMTQSSNAKKAVIIYPDKQTPTHYLITLMDTLTKHNLSSISIATNPTQ